MACTQLLLLSLCAYEYEKLVFKEPKGWYRSDIAATCACAPPLGLWANLYVFHNVATSANQIMLRSTRSQLLAQGTRRDAKVVIVQVGGGCLRHQMGVAVENGDSGRLEVRLRAAFTKRVGSRPRGRVFCDLLGSVGCAKAVLLWCIRRLHE
jgi:hypothetical protein